MVKAAKSVIYRVLNNFLTKVATEKEQLGMLEMLNLLEFSRLILLDKHN